MSLSDVIEAISLVKDLFTNLSKIYKRALAIICVASILFISVLNFLKPKGKLLTSLQVILIIAIVYSVYIILRGQLSIIRFKRQVNEKKKETINPIELWKVYKDAPITKFFPKQEDKYYTVCTNLMIQLGDLPKAEKYIKQIRDKSPNVENMYHQYLALVNANIGDESLYKAHNTIYTDDERQLDIVMIMNKGVYYTMKQNYLNAQTCYEECIEKIEKYDKKDNLLLLAYGNYLKNSAEAKNVGVTDYKTMIREYKKHIDPENVDEYLIFANDVLIAFRKIGASIKEMIKLFHEVVQHVNNLNLTAEQSLSFNISCIDVALAEGIDYTPYLDKTLEKRSYIDNLKMPARFELYKALDRGFQSIGILDDKYRELRKQVRDYMVHSVLKDLDDYLNGLPEEAIFERGYIIEQKAIVSLNIQNQGLEAFKSIVGNAITLYHDHLLKEKELNVYLFILGEMSLEQHCDERILFKDQKYAAKIIKKVLELLQGIKDKNILAPAYLQLSFFYTCMNDLQNCYKYYRLFQKCKSPIEQYNLDIQIEYAQSELLVKVFVFKQAVELASQNDDLQNEKESVQQWFRDCLNSDGALLSVLLGHYLGIDQIKIQEVHACDENRLKKTGSLKEPIKWSHVWLANYNLEIDLLMKQFKNVKDSDRIYFAYGTHPFEIKSSHTVEIFALKGYSIEGNNIINIIYSDLIKEYPFVERLNVLINREIKRAYASLDEKVGIDEE